MKLSSITMLFEIYPKEIYTYSFTNDSLASMDPETVLFLPILVLFLSHSCYVKGLSQITPGPRTASRNGYNGHFRTAHGRLPSDFTDAGTILTTRTFYSNR